LTPQKIVEMDARTVRLRDALERKAAVLDLPITLRQVGSVMGIYFGREPLSPGPIPNKELSLSFHLACSSNGIHMGPEGLLALTTAVDDEALHQVIVGMEDALQRIAS
jgi:glutamate-1-semialdehyde aminotransferase